LLPQSLITPPTQRNVPHFVGNLSTIGDPAHLPVLSRLPAGSSQIAAHTSKIGMLAGMAAGGAAPAAISGTATAVIDVTLVSGLTLLILRRSREHQGLRCVHFPRTYLRRPLRSCAMPRVVPQNYQGTSRSSP
jgi:hypothetical protein